MLYDIIIYKVILFKIPHGDKMINKKYYQKIKRIKNIPSKELNKIYLELKRGLYRDWCYIISEVIAGEVDWYFNRQNEKSEKAYKQYVLNGYK